MVWVNGNRYINQDGKVECDLNAAVYAMNAGENISTIQLLEQDSAEVAKFNLNAERLGLDIRMKQCDVNTHEHDVWHYDPIYDKINLEEYFMSLCSTDIERERVKLELELYHMYNLERLLRCMIWLVDYFNEHNIFWGIGRGSSVSSYCLYLIGLHMVDSIKYELDIHEFLKW